MKKIQKNAVRFDNLKQDFLDDKKYSGTAEATLNGYRYDITRFLKFLSDEQLAVNEAGFKRYVIHLTDSYQHTKGKRAVECLFLPVKHSCPAGQLQYKNE